MSETELTALTDTIDSLKADQVIIQPGTVPVPVVQPDKERLLFTDIFNKDTFLAPFTFAGAMAASNFGPFFTAHFPCEVLRVSVIWTTAGAGAGSPTLQIEKLTGTTAPDSGVLLLTGTVALTGTANTVNWPALTMTKANRVLEKGDRLCIKDGGTPNDLRGLHVEVELKPLGQGHYRFV